MSRVRTGHRPQDWSDPDSGRPARVTGSFLSGSLVVGGPGGVERQRMSERLSRERRMPRVLEHRYANRPRCGAETRNGPCVRIEGHKDNHMTGAALARERERRQANAKPRPIIDLDVYAP